VRRDGGDPTGAAGRPHRRRPVPPPAAQPGRVPVRLQGVARPSRLPPAAARGPAPALRGRHLHELLRSTPRSSSPAPRRALPSPATSSSSLGSPRSWTTATASCLSRIPVTRRTTSPTLRRGGGRGCPRGSRAQAHPVIKSNASCMIPLCHHTTRCS
jgi:hypothetical protein